MEIKSSHTIPAPVERVWEYFTNATLLQQCIPGCEELKPLGDDTFEATIKIGVASIKGTYKGSIKLEDKSPPSSYRLAIEGKSKIGFLKGASNFTLAESQPNETLVTLGGELMVGGRLARVGQRIIGGAAKMMIGQFFKEVTKLAESEAGSANLLGR